MLNIHLHQRYFLNNKCLYNIYYNRFHLNNTTFYLFFFNETAPAKLLADAVQIFLRTQKYLCFFNKVLKMYYTSNGFIYPTKPMHYAYWPSWFLSAR